MEVGESAPDERHKKVEKYKESWYRWVVVGLVTFSQVLIGLANNAVVPL